MRGGRITSRRRYSVAAVLWLLASLAGLPIDALSETQSATPSTAATAAVAKTTDAGTLFSLTLTQGVQAQIFTLDNPYRVIIDLPDVAFKLPAGTGGEPKGLIKVFRYGLFAERKARIVIETSGPVKVASATMTRSGRNVVLNVALAPTDEATFAAAIGAPQNEADDAVPAPAAPKAKTGRPVVVIDAGHGGIDPGAVGANNITEKAVVFAVAQQLEVLLKKTGHYDVQMTRTRDVFVSLDNRLKMSAKVGADLFVSLHADSISAVEFAENVRGATVYTLSERATDERARLMAEKENASDLIAGLAGVDREGDDQVKDILFDLMKRETSNFSADFSKLLVTRLSKNIAMSKDPQRSAAFKVLKQAHAPSVLIELGYMSNSRDQAEMTTKAWQIKVGTAIASAIDSYFNKRAAVEP